MDRLKQWHAHWIQDLGLKATWNENDKAMTFPSGARIVFGHIAYESEKYKYQGAAYQAPWQRSRPAQPLREGLPAGAATHAIPCWWQIWRNRHAVVPRVRAAKRVPTLGFDARSRTCSTSSGG